MAAIVLKKTAAAGVSNPATGKVAIYVDATSGEPSYKDEAGATSSLKGDTGATGATGATGQGVPAGGTTGQVLAKASGTDYDTEWADASGGGGSGLTIADGPWYAPWCKPASPSAQDAEFTGSQLAAMTHVYNSGTPKGTWTEKYSTASFLLTANGGNPELDVYAQARTISVGDYVEITGRYMPVSSTAFLGLFVGFADGVTFNNSSSHVVGAFIHGGSGSGNDVYARAILNTWDGYNTRTSDGTIFDAREIHAVNRAWRVKYEAANTWGLYFSADGVSWKTVQTNYAKTMTPTHVVFGISMLGTPPAPAWATLEYVRVNP